MPAPPTLLVCDHRGSELGGRLTALTAASWQVEVARTVRESLERLARALPDVVVLEPLVADAAAEVELLRTAGAGEVPLLLVAGEGRAEDALAAVAAHAQRAPADLIHRDAGAPEYRARVERLAAQAAARAELRELRHRALHDDRTELLRPQAFQQRLVEHWSAAERHGHDLALVVADLDRFGALNKRYDHTVGDSVLARVGEAIRGTLRTEDVAGRLGGDEFGVLLPYTRKVDAARVVQRLRDRIRALSRRAGRIELSISASLGFETFDGRDLENLDVLRRHAEIALRSAKLSGGDRGVYYRLLGSPAP